MEIDCTIIHSILEELKPYNATLVAVSKTKPNRDIEKVYACGQRIFGENYVQELVLKHEQLPTDIEWHFIGHLQSNKVKYIAPFVSMIHSVDSENLLETINAQAAKNNRIIDCLLQVYIATEETKFGVDDSELQKIVESYLAHNYSHIRLRGLMGMATNTDDMNIVQNEYKRLKSIFDTIALLIEKEKHFDTLSMGMTGDYKIALECGSNMIRIGSKIFGERNYNKL
nr:YggS family pyridoxal phosphate-dependent enzyme [Bacteroidota bacterium]